MSHQSMRRRGSTRTTLRGRSVADVSLPADLIGCVLADPDPTRKITDRFPRPGNQRSSACRTQVNRIVAETRR